MKSCPTCRYIGPDDADFCPNCGAPFSAQPNSSAPETTNVPPYVYAPAYNPHDHTSKFEAQDISEYKLYASLPYLLSVFGVIIALLINKDSLFIRFHVQQALKLIVAEVIFLVAAFLLVWTILVPFVAGIAALVVLVLQFVGFYQAITGKAIALPLLRNLKI